MERFQYHFEPKKGWMNDPNGLCFYKGKYHLFFQHNPYDIKWGPMHWGHAVTDDYLTFDELEIALVPDKEYENDGGCFSGSAIAKDGKLYLFYTSVSRDLGQTQSVAISEDGVNFQKYEKNPVIRHFPEDGSKDFRDPKVIAYKDEYRMVVGSIRNGRGRVLQYKSVNLLDWEYIGVLYETKEYNMPVECPDLFHVDGKWVLMFSKIGAPEYATQFIVGEYDGYHFIPESYQAVEVGPQFYAPQTFEDDKGRRLMVGWFYDWQRPSQESSALENAAADSSKEKPDSVGGLNLPRELHVIDGKLVARPLQEAEPLLVTIEVTESEQISEWLNGRVELHLSSEKVLVRVKGTGAGAEYLDTVKKVQILEDAKGIEVFINEGEHNISVLL